MNQRQERRRFIRRKTRVYGVFKSDIALDETEMLMTDMSMGGCFVKTEEPAAPGTIVTLRFVLPGDEAPLSVVGEVVWWRKGDQGGPPRMGVRFVRVAEEDLEKLKRYLTELVEEELFGEP